MCLTDEEEFEVNTIMKTIGLLENTTYADDLIGAGLSVKLLCALEEGSA